MNVIFHKAGNKVDIAQGTIFLTSKDRVKNKNFTIYHHNDYDTTFIFNSETFKQNFKYDRQAGIYRYIGNDKNGSIQTIARVELYIDRYEKKRITEWLIGMKEQSENIEKIESPKARNDLINIINKYERLLKMTE